MHTVRTESLEWVLIRIARHLRRVLTAYANHYNRARPHRSLQLTMPIDTAAASQRELGTDRRGDVLDGLIHEYRRAAQTQTAPDSPTLHTILVGPR